MVRGQSVYFTVYNRGKKSICLDLRTERGKEIFAALVKTADIVLENFRPGIMDKMGFGYERLRELKPDIILVSVSGFGQYGPYRDRPAFDPLGQAMSGLMHLTGTPVGQPLGTASSIVDRYTALHATIGDAGRAASSRPHRRGPGGRCLPARFGADHGRDPDLVLSRHRRGRRRRRPSAVPGQGRPCGDLRLGPRDGLAADAASPPAMPTRSPIPAPSPGA